MWQSALTDAWVAFKLAGVVHSLIGAVQVVNQAQKRGPSSKGQRKARKRAVRVRRRYVSQHLSLVPGCNACAECSLEQDWEESPKKKSKAAGRGVRIWSLSLLFHH